MTKPWEEDWSYKREGYSGDATEHVVTPGNQAHFGWVDGLGGAYGQSSDDADAGRARLAAQAPAMARLLLAVEWSASVDLGDELEPCCPCCHKMHHNGSGTHATDCELVTVLRDAGVLP